jgi:hypothetical protein
MADAAKVCAQCGIPGNLRCTRCRAVVYCSQTCQKAAWTAGHKTACIPVPTYQPPSDEMRCKVCKGWGKDLLDSATGMCAHCTRGPTTEA